MKMMVIEMVGLLTPGKSNVVLKAAAWMLSDLVRGNAANKVLATVAIAPLIRLLEQENEQVQMAAAGAFVQLGYSTLLRRHSR